MFLNPNAKEFKPSYETMLLTHPHMSSSSNGFILLEETRPKYEVCDEELFLAPISARDSAEMEDMELINVLLADLEHEEAREELKYRLHVKQQQLHARRKVHLGFANLQKSSNKFISIFEGTQNDQIASRCSSMP